MRKATTISGQLTKCMWDNRKHSEHKDTDVLFMSLLYDSKIWTICSCHERRLNTFHTWCLHRTPNIQWETKVPVTDILEKVKLPNLITRLKTQTSPLAWSYALDGCIPKDLLYGEFACVPRPLSWPRLRFQGRLQVGLDNFQHWHFKLGRCSKQQTILEGSAAPGSSRIWREVVEREESAAGPKP